MVGMHAAHDMHLRHPAVAAGTHDFLYFGQRMVPRPRFASPATVRTETAVEDADVRRFDMEIAVVIDHVAAFAMPHTTGQFGQQRQRRIVPQRLRLIAGYASAGGHPFRYTAAYSLLVKHSFQRYEKEIYKHRPNAANMNSRLEGGCTYLVYRKPDG